MTISNGRRLRRGSAASLRLRLPWFGLVIASVLVSSALAAPATVKLVSVRAKGNTPLPFAMLGTQGAHRSVSADGRFVAFQAYDDGWHIFVRDTALGTTERVSVSTSGEPADYDSEDAAISDDGRYVVFESGATNLAPGDRGWGGIFLRDRQARTTERIDVDAAGRSANLYSYAPFVSANGRYVVFISYASNLVAHDANRDESDVFVRDRVKHTTELVDVSSQGAQSNGVNDQPALSADGRYVVFVSTAPNLSADPVAGGFHVFLRDRVAHVTELASPRASGGEGNEAWPTVSDDGRYVAFGSSASDLVRRDTNHATDIFVRDRVNNITQRVSVSGIEAQANDGSDFAAISGDGRYVAFQSRASNLVAHDTNNQADVFVRDLERGLTKLVSHSSAGASLDALSADGHYLAFGSAAHGRGGTGVYLEQIGDDGWDMYGMNVLPADGVDFGSVATSASATQTLWVKNKGTLPLHLQKVELAGPDAAQFSLGNGCDTTLPVDEGCPVHVTFHPGSAGDLIAELRVVSAEDLVRTRSVTGTGVAD